MDDSHLIMFLFVMFTMRLKRFDSSKCWEWLGTRRLMRRLAILTYLRIQARVSLARCYVNMGENGAIRVAALT